MVARPGDDCSNNFMHEHCVHRHKLVRIIVYVMPHNSVAKFNVRWVQLQFLWGGEKKKTSQ